MRTDLHKAWNLGRLVRVWTVRDGKKVPGDHVLVIGYEGNGFYNVKVFKNDRVLIYHEDDIMKKGE